MALRGWPGDEEELEGGVLTGGGVLVEPDVSLGSAGKGEVGSYAPADLRGGGKHFWVSGRTSGRILWQNVGQNVGKERWKKGVGKVEVDRCLLNQRLKEVSASGPFCHSAIP